MVFVKVLIFFFFQKYQLVFVFTPLELSSWSLDRLGLRASRWRMLVGEWLSRSRANAKTSSSQRHCFQVAFSWTCSASRRARRSFATVSSELENACNTRSLEISCVYETFHEPHLVLQGWIQGEDS